MGWLQDNCPRLALAAQQHNQVVHAREARRQRKVGQVHRLEALVAHRDLHLVRAGASAHLGKRQRSYLRERSRKLKDAERGLAHVRRDLATVDKWEPEWAR